MKTMKTPISAEKKKKYYLIGIIKVSYTLHFCQELMKTAANLYTGPIYNTW